MLNCYELGLLRIKGGEKWQEKIKRIELENKKQLFYSFLLALMCLLNYKHLSEEEIEQLTFEISSVKKVDSMAKEELLKNFIKSLGTRIYFSRWYWLCQNSS